MPETPTNGCLQTDSHTRCWWCGELPDYVEYHDNEWGRPVTDDARLFEKICLEGFQAGLSWLTVLRKREAFRDAFHQFDFRRVARIQKRTVDRLVANPAIIRHRGKIESTINNAKRAAELVETHDSLFAFFETFRPPRRKRLETLSDMVAKTPESIAMSKELKRLGWSFVGPTTCYAFMQAMGLVNDHFAECDRWEAIENEQLAFANRATTGRGYAATD